MGWAPILAGRAERPPHLQSLYPISCGVLMLQNPAVLRGVFPAGKHAHIDDHSVLTLFVWQLRRINPVFYMMITCLDIDGLVQERCNSIVNALELHLSCTNPSICYQQRISQMLYDKKYKSCKSMCCPYMKDGDLFFFFPFLFYISLMKVNDWSRSQFCTCHDSSTVVTCAKL